MSRVIDASVVIAALVGGGPEAGWAEDQLAQPDLIAPHHMPIEAANVLRRGMLAGRISRDAATLAHEDLTALPVRLVPYEPLADRVWELRDVVSAYDACYVALAEALAVPLATLDRRIQNAPGTHCDFVSPPGAS